MSDRQIFAAIPLVTAVAMLAAQVLLWIGPVTKLSGEDARAAVRYALAAASTR